MVCKKCGYELSSNETKCPICGEENSIISSIGNTDNSKSVLPESKAIAVLAIVFSCLGGWLGIVFAIVGLSQYKEPQNRMKCKIALCIFCFELVFFFILGFILGMMGIQV